ncbi:MAG: flavodoxin domain-containing protein [Desulforhopalus sp.]|nr:flavodoxin domain-containing protein [Desulforhopalus sp.]
MKKALIAYHSRTGKTEAMANYIGEGLRFCAIEVAVKKISEIDNELDIVGYDAYIFGCPTYHKDMTGGMKQFLFKAELANLVGKIGGAFGSHTHSGESAPMLFDTMMYVFKMDMTDLGPLKLTEDMVGNTEGIKACQDYGKSLGEKLARH